MLILPRCAANRRRRCSGEPTLSQPFRVQVFFGARWVRQCCLVSWSSWSLKTHVYSSFSSRGHLHPIYFSFCVQTLSYNSFSTWSLRNQVLGSSSVEAFLLSWQRPIAMLASRPLSRWSMSQTLWESVGFFALEHYMGPVVLDNYGMLLFWESMVTLMFGDLRMNINRIRLYQTSMLSMLPILRIWHWNWSIHMGSGQIS